MYSPWTCLPCVVSEIFAFRWGQGRCLDLCPIPAYINRIHPEYIPALQIGQVFELRLAPDHAEKLARLKHITPRPQFISVEHPTNTTTGHIFVDEPSSTNFSAAKPASASVTGTTVTKPRISYEETKNTFLPAVFPLMLQNIYLNVREVWNSPQFWAEAFGILFKNCGYWLFPLAVACVLPICAFIFAVWLFFLNAGAEEISYVAHALSPQSALDDEDPDEESPLDQILYPYGADKLQLTAYLTQEFAKNELLEVDLSHEKEKSDQLAEQKRSLEQELSNRQAKNSRLLSQKDLIQGELTGTCKQYTAAEAKNKEVLAAIQARIVELEAQFEAGTKKQAAHSLSLRKCRKLKKKEKRSFVKKRMQDIGIFMRHINYWKDASSYLYELIEESGDALAEASADIKASEADRLKLKAKLKACHKDLDDYGADLEDYEPDLKEYKADIKDYESDLMDCEADLKDCKADLEESRADLKAAKTERDNLKVQVWHAETKTRESDDKFTEASKRAADFESEYTKLISENARIASDYVDLQKEFKDKQEELAQEQEAKLDRERKVSDQLRGENAVLKEALQKALNSQTVTTAPSTHRADGVPTVKIPGAFNDTDEDEAAEAIDDTADFAPREVIEEFADDTLESGNDDSRLPDDRNFYDAASHVEVSEGMGEAAENESPDPINHAAKVAPKYIIEDLPEITFEYEHDDHDLFGEHETIGGSTDVEAPEATNELGDDELAETIDHAAHIAPEETTEELENDGFEYDSDDTQMSLFGERELQREALNAQQQVLQVNEVQEDGDKAVDPIILVSRPPAFAYPAITLPVYSLLCYWENQTILNQQSTQLVSQATIADMAETKNEKERIEKLQGTIWVVFDERRRDISSKALLSRARSTRLNSTFNAVRRSACITMGLVEHVTKVQWERTPEELGKLPLSLLTSNATNNYSYTKKPEFPESRRRRHSIAYGDLDETTFKKTGCTIPKRTPRDGIETYPAYKGRLNNGEMLGMKRVNAAVLDLVLEQRDRMIQGTQGVPPVEQRSLTEQFFQVKASNSSDLTIGGSMASLTDVLGIDNLRQHQVDAGRGEAISDIINGNVIDNTRSTWSKSNTKNEICEVRTLNHLRDSPASPAKSTSSPTLNPTAGALSPQATTPTPTATSGLPANAPTQPRNSAPAIAPTHLQSSAPANAPTGPSASSRPNTWMGHSNNTTSPTARAMQGPFMFGNGQAPGFAFNSGPQQNTNNYTDNGYGNAQQPGLFRPPTGPASASNMGGGGGGGYSIRGGSRNTGRGGAGRGRFSGCRR